MEWNRNNTYSSNKEWGDSQFVEKSLSNICYWISRLDGNINSFLCVWEPTRLSWHKDREKAFLAWIPTYYLWVLKLSFLLACTFHSFCCNFKEGLIWIWDENCSDIFAKVPQVARRPCHQQGATMLPVTLFNRPTYGKVGNDLSWSEIVPKRGQEDNSRLPRK